jgi:hypothetical protein
MSTKNLTQFTKNLNIDEDKEDLPEIEIDTIDVQFNNDVEDDITDDYKYSRKKLINVIQSAEGVMKHALMDMKNNPGPRPVEAFSTLIKVMNETHTNLMNLHEKMKKIKPSKPIENNDKDKPIQSTINDIIDKIEKAEKVKNDGAI